MSKPAREETVRDIRDFARHQKHAECEILISGWADELEAAQNRIAELEKECLDWQKACEAYAIELADLREAQASEAKDD